MVGGLATSYANFVMRSTGAYGVWAGTGPFTYSATFTVCGEVVPTSFMFDGSPKSSLVTENQQRCTVTASVTATSPYGTTTVQVGSISVVDTFALVLAPTMNWSNSVDAGQTLVSSGASWSSYGGRVSSAAKAYRCLSASINTGCTLISQTNTNSMNYTPSITDVGFYIVFEFLGTIGNVTKSTFTPFILVK
jgi:hypothetical protein